MNMDGDTNKCQQIDSYNRGFVLYSIRYLLPIGSEVPHASSASVGLIYLHT